MILAGMVETGERHQTARPNRSTSPASPTLGKVAEGQGRGAANNGQSHFARSLAAVKDWCRTTRHRPVREQRAWLSRYSTVTTPTMASRGTCGGYGNIATKSSGSGTSGWNVEHEGSHSMGELQRVPRPSRAASGQDHGPLHHDGTNLTREEPDAGIPLVRVCEGRRGQPPRLPGTRLAYRPSRAYGLKPQLFRPRGLSTGGRAALLSLHCARLLPLPGLGLETVEVRHAFLCRLSARRAQGSRAHLMKLRYEARASISIVDSV